jgi:hypothetical protein
MKLVGLSFLERGISSSDRSAERLGMIYSMDALVPGFYIWAGRWTFCLGGSEAEENYSGMIHRFPFREALPTIGVAIVLPGYRIFSTYHGSYDA